MGNWLGRVFSLALFVVAVAWAAPAAHAEDVFLIVSVEPEFDTTLEDYVEGYDWGSEVLVVKIGSLTNNAPDPRETEFLPEAEPPSVPLDDLELQLADLVGNESTIFGSFTVEEFDSEEESTEVPHMVTPGAAVIPAEIQAAVFAASADIAALAGGSSSTGEIVDIVKTYLEGDFTSEEVAEALFGATELLGGTGPEDDLFSCEAEGELFPHQPDDEGPIFVFGISFDQDGTLTTDVCLPADVEVKESSVNLKKKGTVSVAIYDSETLETDDIATVEIGGVSAEKIHYAKNKVTAQFDVQDLVDAFALTSSTTEVLVVAILGDDDATCFAGRGNVNGRGSLVSGGPARRAPRPPPIHGACARITVFGQTRVT